MPAHVDDHQVFLVTGEGSPMRGVLAEAGRVARCDAHVLLAGEPGTGKEALARHLHALSGRAGPFVAMRRGASAELRVMTELFGAAEPAVTAPGGLLAAARGGTLLVEEIADLPPSVQATLAFHLRFRQARGPAAGPRVVATTTRGVDAALHEGLLRRDLYDTFPCAIPLPPLRERPDDALAVFALLWSRRGGGRAVDPDAVELVRSHPWPGNVAELDAFASRLAFLCDAAPIRAADVAALLRAPRGAATALAAPVDVRAAVAEIEEALVAWALDVSAGDPAAAGDLLGRDARALLAPLRRRGRGAVLLS